MRLVLKTLNFPINIDYFPINIDYFHKTNGSCIENDDFLNFQINDRAICQLLHSKRRSNQHFSIGSEDSAVENEASSMILQQNTKILLVKLTSFIPKGQRVGAEFHVSKNDKFCIKQMTSLYRAGQAGAVDLGAW